MSTILGDLIPDKSTRDVNQAANLVKEGLQELILCTLSRQVSSRRLCSMEAPA